MTTLLNIRLAQIKRELNDTGLRTILIFGLLLFQIFASFKIYQKTTSAIYLTASIFFVCLWLQFLRKDKLFVYNHIDKPELEIYSEYFVLTFPFAILSLFTANWFCYPILLALLCTVPFLKFTLKQKTYFKHISSIIPASNFEWISGFRKSFLSIITLYVLAIGFCWFRILPLFILWFITMMVVSFYSEGEPLQILKEGGFSAKKFIQQKLFRHSKYILLLYAPVVLINTIFNSNDLLLILFFIPMQLSLLWLAICFKYSSYQPNENLSGNNIILSVVSVCSIIPFFLPVPVIMSVVYYNKATNNLNNYLND